MHLGSVMWGTAEVPRGDSAGTRAQQAAVSIPAEADAAEAAAEQVNAGGADDQIGVGAAPADRSTQGAGHQGAVQLPFPDITFNCII